MTDEQLSLPNIHLSQISPEYTVTQSNDLIMSRQNLTIQERRIIYAFASLIHKEDNNFKTHRIKVKDIADLLGIQTKNYYRRVQELVVGLQQKGVYIQRENSELYVNWVASSEYFHGQGFVELEFSQKMKPYLLELQQRFTPFKLRNVLRLRSEYSMRMYELLKKDEYRKRVQYSVENLRYLLNIEHNKYRPYGNFKNRILKRAQSELADYTDISFDFKEMKEGANGQKVVNIEFTINSNSRYVKKVIDKSGFEEIISLMAAYGVKEPTAKKLLEDCGKEKVVRNIEFIASQNQSNYNNIAGVLVDAIRKDYAAGAQPNMLPEEHDSIKDKEKAISVERIVQQLIQKYKQNNRGPIPGWMLKGEFRSQLANRLDATDDEISKYEEQWFPMLLRMIKS